MIIGLLESGEDSPAGGFWRRRAGTGLRWVFFVPAGIVAGAVCSLVVSLPIGIMGLVFNSGFLETAGLVFGGFSAGACAIDFGNTIAPCKNKRGPTLATLTFIIALSLFQMIVAFSAADWGRVLQALAIPIGAFMSAALVREAEPKVGKI